MLPVYLRILGRVILNGKISSSYYRKSRSRYGEHTLKVRKMSVDGYYILFQIRGSQVVVLRVLHCRQDIEGKLFE